MPERCRPSRFCGSLFDILLLCFRNTAEWCSFELQSVKVSFQLLAFDFQLPSSLRFQPSSLLSQLRSVGVPSIRFGASSSPHPPRSVRAALYCRGTSYFPHSSLRSPSSFNLQLSAFGFQLSAFSFQLSTFSFSRLTPWSSTLSRRPPDSRILEERVLRSKKIKISQDLVILNTRHKCLSYIKLDD